MKKPFNRALALILLALCGCSLPARQLVRIPDQTKPIEDPEKGRIYVVSGGVRNADIQDGDADIGRIGPGGRLSWEREPGAALIRSYGANKAWDEAIQVEKGKSHYLRQEQNGKLKVLSPEDGAALAADADLPVEAGDAERAASEARRKSRPYFLKGPWDGTNDVSALYDVFRKGLRLQFKRELVLRHRKGSSLALGFSGGFYTTLNSKARILYEDDTIRTGALDVTAFPFSLALYRYGRVGFFSGKWGIGVTAYQAKVRIDMGEAGGPYKGKHFGTNLVIPLEFVTSVSERTFFRFNEIIEFPLDRGGKFDNSRGDRYIEMIPFAGIFFGFSIGRYF